MSSPVAIAEAGTTDYRPAQQRVIDLLGRHGDDAPDLGPEVAIALKEELDERLADVVDLIPAGEDLWVGKTPLAAFNACQGRWKAQLDAPFAWSVPAVRGTVSHKAIELTLNWRGEVEPGRAVDAAITHLIDDDHQSAGRFLRTLSTVDLAELRSAAVDLVTAFEECFPPLKPRWRPVIDGRSRAELCGDRIVLSGRPDLTLGQAMRAGKVIIDLKTGNPHQHHVDDLRFYALIDTLRVGLPPRRLATVYLDAGQPVAETVTAGVLEVDRARRADGDRDDRDPVGHRADRTPTSAALHVVSRRRHVRLRPGVDGSGGDRTVIRTVRRRPWHPSSGTGRTTGSMPTRRRGRHPPWR